MLDKETNWKTLNLKQWIRAHSSSVLQRLPQPIHDQIRCLWKLMFTDEYISSRHRRLIGEQLHQRLRTGPGPSFWILSWTTWFSNAFQRPQQMARALSDIGCQVIYYEPWEFEANFTSKEGFLERQFIGVRDITAQLHLLRCPRYLLPDYLVKSPPDALLMTWPHQAILIPPDTSSFVIYEMVDDHALVSHVDNAWNKTHLEWIRKADVMVATSDALLRQLYPERPDALLIPNGVNLEDWISSKPPVPEDMVAARRFSVVIGYHGAISQWFNWEMWEHAARVRPDWAFVLIGIPFLITQENVRTRVSRYPNMYYLGPKLYENLASYTTHFDVATIPFIINQITNACSPVKLFEYMATGKPIVASPMREILKYKSALIADSPDVFVKQLEQALIKKDDPEYRFILKHEAEANTWRLRAEVLCQAIESVRRRQNNIPRRQKKANPYISITTDIKDAKNKG